MNLTSAVKGLKVKGDEEHIRKHLSSVSLNAVVKYTLKSSLTALKPLYKALYGVELTLTASSTQMDGVVIMAL